MYISGRTRLFWTSVGRSLARHDHPGRGPGPALRGTTLRKDPSTCLANPLSASICDALVPIDEFEVILLDRPVRFTETLRRADKF